MSGTPNPIEQLQTAWSEFKTYHERELEEVKKNGQATQETKNTLDAIQKRLDAAEVALKRPAGINGIKTADAAEHSAERKAFAGFLAKGLEKLSADEQKALISSDDTTGGYLATTDYEGEILKGVVEFSPLRAYARIRQTSAKSVRFPKRTGTVSAVWVAEPGTRPDTNNVSFGLEDIPNHELFAKAAVSQQDLEDSQFNLEQYLAEEFSEQFGVAEAAGFLLGNGVGKPEGILAAGLEAIASGAAADIEDADCLIELQGSLKGAYSRNAIWLMNRKTITRIRKLKDLNGQYIWQPGLASAVPATILGRPYEEAPDMPVIATNALVAAYGDFRRGYLVVDRVQLSVQRDPYTDADAGNVIFRARKRVGGQVINPEAIKLLQVKA